MFIQPCFIRKNTKELRDKLEDFGLKLINSNNITVDCHNYDGNGNHRSIDEGRAIITYYSNHYVIIYDIDKAANKNRIDCNYNEDLFLAIAALRDDTDKNQYFKHNSKSHFYKCDMNSFKDYFDDCNKELDDHIEDYHKATVEELIDFFNKK